MYVSHTDICDLVSIITGENISFVYKVANRRAGKVWEDRLMNKRNGERLMETSDEVITKNLEEKEEAVNKIGIMAQNNRSSYKSKMVNIRNVLQVKSVRKTM